MAAKAPKKNKYHVMVRNIGSPEAPDQGIFSASTVDKHLQMWAEDGYKLMVSFPIGRQKIEGRSAPIEGVYFLFELVE